MLIYDAIAYAARDEPRPTSRRGSSCGHWWRCCSRCSSCRSGSSKWWASACGGWFSACVAERSDGGQQNRSMMTMEVETVTGVRDDVPLFSRGASHWDV